MAFEQQQGEAMHLLRSIENGTTPMSSVAHYVEEADPALVYLLLTWLRSRYSGDHPAAEGVLGRLVELTGQKPSIQRMMREGAGDPIVTWFEAEHEYRDFDASAFVELVVEKLEG